MAKILTFPSNKLQPLRVRSSQSHFVSVEILDRRKRRRTRMMMQLLISDAASFKALKGFTDAAVAKGYVHTFTIGQTALLRRFIADTTDLVMDGLVAIRVDGRLVRPQIAKRA